MYAKSSIKPKKNRPIGYQCQDCEEFFSAKERAVHCPSCFSRDRSNLIILHMEDDHDRVEWLELVDFSAGD